jgi:hypothetical protein
MPPPPYGKRYFQGLSNSLTTKYYDSSITNDTVNESYYQSI